MGSHLCEKASLQSWLASFTLVQGLFTPSIAVHVCLEWRPNCNSVWSYHHMLLSRIALMPYFAMLWHTTPGDSTPYWTIPSCCHVVSSVLFALAHRALSTILLYSCNTICSVYCTGTSLYYKTWYHIVQDYTIPCMVSYVIHTLWKFLYLTMHFGDLGSLCVSRALSNRRPTTNVGLLQLLF